MTEKCAFAALINDVFDQMLLTIVSSDDTYLLSRVANQSHVLIYRYNVFSLTKILIIERSWAEFSFILEIRDIYELESVGKASVGGDKLWVGDNICEISQFSLICWVCISPTVQLRDVSSGSALSIELYRRNSKSNESREQRLIQLGELLQCHVFDNWWQLEVVSKQHNSLEATTIDRVGVL